MIITGRFNVYSVEVEQALMQHSAVQDCAVVGLPDDKWGERVTAVVRPTRAAASPQPTCARSSRTGSAVSSEGWPDLPRSRVGKVLKGEVKSRLLDQAQPMTPDTKGP
jgi:fatty-acyl-CoA synthase